MSHFLHLKPQRQSYWRGIGEGLERQWDAGFSPPLQVEKHFDFRPTLFVLHCLWSHCSFKHKCKISFSHKKAEVIQNKIQELQKEKTLTEKCFVITLKAGSNGKKCLNSFSHRLRKLSSLRFIIHQWVSTSPVPWPLTSTVTTISEEERTEQEPSLCWSDYNLPDIKIIRLRTLHSYTQVSI